MIGEAPPESATIPGAEALWTPRQADFDHFAALSGDDNPIHVDPAVSARTRYGRTIAHGMLLYARAWALVRQAIPGGHIRQMLSFPNPAYVNEPLRVRLLPGGGRLAEFRVERIADGLSVLNGETLIGEEPPPPVAARPHDDDAADGDLHANGIRVGQRAEIARSFTHPEVTDFAALAGERQGLSEVPEPLIGSLFSHLLGVRLPGFGTSYLKQQLHFLSPAMLGETLHASVEVVRLRPEKSIIDLATVCLSEGGRAIARGRAMVLVRDVGMGLPAR